MKPETKYRKSVVDPFLKTLKHCWVETIQQKMKHGSADYYLCLRGLFIYFEVKWLGGELTDLQKDKMLLCKKRGQGIAICAHPGNWELVTSLLSKLDNGEKCNVEDEVQRINLVPVPNGNAKARASRDGRKNRVSNQPHVKGRARSAGSDFEGV